MAKQTETEPLESAEASLIPDSRQTRWAVFLENARKVNPVRFDRQKENGEFELIPASFQ